MATILKCKMCGGDISVNSDMTLGTCQYCGSTMTIPRVDSEKKIRLFNHANQYRLNCEFDRAYDAYKMISEEDEKESEAYWGMVLSEYGVEYVEDPSTKKRVPTCHRTLIKSVKNDTNYELAYKYADTERKLYYQDEADEIERIQKAILSISAKEDPYDVFICYKESDDNTGERTEDSVAAQEIYDELTNKGLKVFFSRITLADKLGKDYEPYIFSALKTAKVMLVVGTQNSNINSTWVKNEWSRYLQFMSNDEQKTLIPVYKNMDVYELPSELSRFQAQDFNKIGAIQDLVISVKKLVSTENRIASDEALNNLIKEQIEKEKKQKARERALEEKRNKAKVIANRSSVIIKKLLPFAITIILLLFLFLIVLPFFTYRYSSNQRDKGNYDAAIRAFQIIKPYKDSRNQILYSKYLKAKELLEKKQYDDAYNIFLELGTYNSAEEYANEAILGKETDYYINGNYDEAEQCFEGLYANNNYARKIAQFKIDLADNYEEQGNEVAAIFIYTDIIENQDVLHLTDLEKSKVYLQDINIEKDKYVLGTQISFAGKEWKILRIDNEEMVLISSEPNAYRCKYTSIKNNSNDYDWNHSVVKKALNTNYYGLLSEKERSLISGTDGDNKVRILTIDEAQTYFSSDKERKNFFSSPCWLLDDTQNENGYIIDETGAIVEYAKKGDSIDNYPLIVVNFKDVNMLY